MFPSGGRGTVRVYLVDIAADTAMVATGVSSKTDYTNRQKMPLHTHILSGASAVVAAHRTEHRKFLSHHGPWFGIQAARRWHCPWLLLVFHTTQSGLLAHASQHCVWLLNGNEARSGASCMQVPREKLRGAAHIGAGAAIANVPANWASANAGWQPSRSNTSRTTGSGNAAEKHRPAILDGFYFCC